MGGSMAAVRWWQNFCFSAAVEAAAQWWRRRQRQHGGGGGGGGSPITPATALLILLIIAAAQLGEVAVYLCVLRGSGGLLEGLSSSNVDGMVW
jgi:hypothetical protein